MQRIWRKRCTYGCYGSATRMRFVTPSTTSTLANNLVKEHAVLERRQASGIDIDEAPAHEQLETLPAFDRDLDTAQRVLRLGTVLQQLRPKCRAAVELRFTHDLSYREIAMHLGVSPQMAKKYVAQGLSHCRRRMAQLG